MADPKKLKKKKEHGRRDILFSVARVPNSQRIFVGSSDFNIYEMDLTKDKLEPKELGKHESYVTGVALSGNTLITGSYDQKLTWWDIDKQSQIRSIGAHQRWIRGVFASPDGQVVASIADDMVCKLWDVKSGKLKFELRDHKEKTPNHYPSMLYACAFSRDNKYLATGDKVGHVAIWETATGKKVSEVESPGMYTWDPRQRRHSIGGIRSLAFSPDGKQLAVGGIGKIGNIDHLGGKARLEVFDWQASKSLMVIEAKEKGLIQHLEYPKDGNWLLGAGGANGGLLVFYDLKNKKVMSEEKAPMHIHDLVHTEDFGTIIAVGHNKIAIFEM